MINVSRFCSTLATLLNSGVPILTAMKITRNLLGNVHMQRAVEESKEEIAAGASMTAHLSNRVFFRHGYAYDKTRRELWRTRANATNSV